MSMSDPISDMLTRIRNANHVKKNSVLVPHSSLKEEIIKLLVREGFIASYSVKEKQIYLNLKYLDSKKVRIIRGLKRVSKPGLRVYAQVGQIPKIYNSLGIVILSTSLGILTDKEAKIKNVGGEVLAFVW
jgi:small subunit ribosomal protein S8